VQVCAVQVEPAPVSHCPQAPPPLPQLSALLPSMQNAVVPLPVQQPVRQGLSVPGPQPATVPLSPPPLPVTVQVPAVQASVAPQALQAVPEVPQLALVPGSTHLLSVPQHPLQFAGPHLGAPQEGTTAKRKPIKAPASEL